MAKPNKENIITEMLVELKTGITYSECFALISRKWTLGETTFKRYWKDANLLHKKVQLQIQHEANHSEVLQKAKDVENGLKTKSERVMQLQNEADRITSLLASGTVLDCYYSPATKEVDEYERKLTPSEVSNFQKTLVAINTQIGKVQGDDAPIKTQEEGMIKVLNVNKP